MLENIKVAADGHYQMLKSMATITVQDAQRLVVVPYDMAVFLFPFLLKIILKSTKTILTTISNANLNLTPVLEGSNKIVVTVPK